MPDRRLAGARQRYGGSVTIGAILNERDGLQVAGLAGLSFHRRLQAGFGELAGNPAGGELISRLQAHAAAKLVRADVSRSRRRSDCWIAWKPGSCFAGTPVCAPAVATARACCNIRHAGDPARMQNKNAPQNQSGAPLDLSSRPGISCHAVLEQATCAVFLKEDRMKFTDAKNLNRKAGGPGFPATQYWSKLRVRSSLKKTA
jgi:hypothetical protein